MEIRTALECQGLERQALNQLSSIHRTLLMFDLVSKHSGNKTNILVIYVRAYTLGCFFFASVFVLSKEVVLYLLIIVASDVCESFMFGACFVIQYLESFQKFYFSR